ncbi:hypothetical protein J5N97_010211 [Dioscorea zingiberensis]|uniref:Uncharacterized protein n=1 Tax=Dioscorea zingiberensis TaxID=325984 RepID=A0A9D5CYQ2_9LILI|nr:hypothetical protein J5N97_010211 [Dioscorea zingiberensis]
MLLFLAAINSQCFQEYRRGANVEVDVAQDSAAAGVDVLAGQGCRWLHQVVALDQGAELDRQRLPGWISSRCIQIREAPLANVGVAYNPPIAPRIDDIPSPNPGMPLESQVGSANPQDFNAGAQGNIGVEEVPLNPVQGDIPIAESAAPLNLPGA